MKMQRKIAFFGYMVVSLLLTLFGVRYYFFNELMPYHLEALAVPWAELPGGVRFMLVEFMHGVGAGFLTLAVAMFVLLLVPFRRGERWADWTLPGLGLTILILLKIMLCRVVENTTAQPPTTVIWVALGVVAFSAIVTKCPCTCCNKNKE
jgi:peptidoglycan/LPS O-acetylase OafA/YrhL